MPVRSGASPAVRAALLYTIGGILLLVGVVFFILGNVGRPVGGRKLWY